MPLRNHQRSDTRDSPPAALFGLRRPHVQEVPQPSEPSTPVVPDAPVTPADPDPGTPADPQRPATVPDPDEPATPIVPEPQPVEPPQPQTDPDLGGAAQAAGTLHAQPPGSARSETVPCHVNLSLHTAVSPWQGLTADP